MCDSKATVASLIFFHPNPNPNPSPCYISVRSLLMTYFPFFTDPDPNPSAAGTVVSSHYDLDRMVFVLLRGTKTWLISPPKVEMSATFL